MYKYFLMHLHSVMSYNIPKPVAGVSLPGALPVNVAGAVSSGRPRVSWLHTW